MDINVKDPKFLRWAGSVLVVLVVVPIYFISASYPFTYKSGQAVVGQLEGQHQKLSRDLEKARLLVRNLDGVIRIETLRGRDLWLEESKGHTGLLTSGRDVPQQFRHLVFIGQQRFCNLPLLMQCVVFLFHPVEVSIEGGYHQTAIFLSRLANLNRIVNVSNINMQGEDKQEDSPVTVKTDMLLTAYTLNQTVGNHPELEGQGNKTLAQVDIGKKSGKPSSASQAGNQGVSK